MKKTLLLSSLMIAFVALIGCDKPANKAANRLTTKEMADFKKDMKANPVDSGGTASGEMAKPVAPKVGADAPDLEGVDLDGESFKLSDYEGKVVMLDFWGDW